MSSLISTLKQTDFRTGIQNFRLEDHPRAITLARAGLFTAGTLVLAPAVIVGGLNVVGFTASGVAAGSIATGIQSGVYAGLTTGFFSTCQSIGATWVVGSGSVLTGIGSLSAGVFLPSASHKTGSAPVPNHPAGSNRT